MTAKPQTFNGDLASLPPALAPLTRLPRWVVWKWELRKSRGADKWTKPPYRASDPKWPAKSNDPSTWDTYDVALTAFTGGACDGIGFMLRDAQIGAGDLDHVRDPASGTLLTWAEQLVLEANEAGAYVELTVSGTGLRFIGVAHGPEIHRKFIFDRQTGAGIELYRNCTRYITVSGLGSVKRCPDMQVIDPLIDRLFARYGAPPPDQYDFNSAGLQSGSIDYQNLIQNGAPQGDRSEYFQAVVWHLAGQGLSPDEIADELAKHPGGIGRKYSGRLLGEVERSYQKWQIHKRAAVTGSAAATGTSWPQIHITPGELPHVVNQAEDALLLLGREIYQRGDLVVRPISSNPGPWPLSWRLLPMTKPHLIETLTCAARFLKYDRRAKGWVAVDAPENIADAYLGRTGKWKLPVLGGIVHTPFLRADGTICEAPGYDAASGLLFKPDGQAFPSVPNDPHKAEALAALEQLKRLIASFPFVDEPDRAVALSGILTMLDRRVMATAPLHAFTAPAAGTGKSLLIDLFAILATGRPMTVTSQGRTEEELEKRLGACLLAGDPAISLDNCKHPLDSVFLCQCLTQEKVNVRLLGYSRSVECPMNTLFFANGNNLTIVGDLVRRTLMGRIDAKCERPETRTFSENIVKTAYAKRGALVVAALTILRAWHLAQERGATSSAAPLGGFEQWSARVRDALVWLGCSDPCETIVKVRGNDPEQEALEAVIMQWKDHLGIDKKHTVQEVIERAINVRDFWNALLAIAESRSGGGMISNERFGRWLRKIEGKFAGGLRLLQDGSSKGYSKWRLSDE
jgi:hypothetical protein